MAPASAQHGANTVATTQPAAITATALIPGAGRFASWLQLPSGHGTAHGATLTVPARGSSVAAAYFRGQLKECEQKYGELP